MKADISSLTIMLDTSKPDNLTNELKKQQYITKKLAETLQTKQSSTPTQTELTMQEKQDIIDTIKPANYANESIDSNIIPIERRKYNTTL